MATLNTFTETPNPVPNGTTGTVSVTFNVTPATPDKATNLSIYISEYKSFVAVPGAVIKGTPAEATPVVSIGSTNTGWEIRTSVGTLGALGSNRFSLAY